jgi:RNA polymerase sigma-70 factor, ECF subfamily
VPLGSPRRLEPERLGDHLDRLFRAAWAMCGDRHDGEDLVQETLARVLSRPRFVRNDDDLGYLLQALRNTHANRLRRASRRPVEVERDDERAVTPDRFDMRRPEVSLEVSELFAAIAGLPGDARDVIVAVDVTGLSYREAAKLLGVTETTLATRLYRARDRVAQEMSGEPASRVS